MCENLTWGFPVCSAAETSYRIEMLLVASLDIILSNNQIIMALIRLHGCACWQVFAFVVANSEDRFSRVEAHFIVNHKYIYPAKNLYYL